MFANVLKSAVVAAILLAAVNEARAQTGQRYQIQVRNPYGSTEWWPRYGGSYDYQTFINTLQSLPSAGYHYVSYRIVGQNFNPPTGKSLADYQAEVARAYQRAKEARDWAQGHVGRLTQQQFNEVNQKINEFNATLSTAQQGPYGSHFGGISRMGNIPSSWIATANEQYGIYYRRPGINWTYYFTVNGLSNAQQTCANLRRQYPGYEFGYARR